MANKKTARKSAVKKNVIKPRLDDDGNVASPVDVHDTDDPGDETQRRYRYQHAYARKRRIAARRQKSDVPLTA